MNNIIPSLKYALLTLKHKWFVYLAGRKLGVPLWQLIIHDLSKFGPAELPAYGRQFFGTKDRPEEFKKAWWHHWFRNPHHWEYYDQDKVCDRDTGGFVNEIPEKYVREMIADWMGASRAYDGRYPVNVHTWPWFTKNFDKIKLHPETRRLVLRILVQNGFGNYVSIHDYPEVRE
jgi:hypothetical protein